jgi:hypothetical protein
LFETDVALAGAFTNPAASAPPIESLIWLSTSLLGSVAR